MVIRPATEADIPGILEMAREFVGESGYGYTFDPERSEWLVRVYLADPFHAFMVADVDGQIAGAWVAVVAYEWTVEPMCYVVKWYMRRPYRGQGLGHALFGALTDWADTAGVMDTFVTSTAEIGQTGAFTGLCESHGFVRLGPTLVRRKQ